jgi:hypothetical protein
MTVISDKLTSLELYTNAKKVDGEKSAFPKVVENLLNELRAAGNTQDILREGNIFSLF